MNSKAVTFVSLDLIANKILKHPLMRSLNYEDIIDHAVTVLRLLKCPGSMKEETCTRTLENHMAHIPKDCLNVKAVEFIDANGAQYPLVYSNNTLGAQMNKLDRKTAYARSIESSFQYSEKIYCDPSVDKVVKPDCTLKVYNQEIAAGFKYKINNQHIITSMQDGKILIVYDRINTDEDGIPLIINSESLIKAISNYIKVQVFEVLVDLGEISERSLTRAEQEYSWYAGQTQTEFQGIGSVDEMESFINAHVSLFNVTTLHSDRYESSADKEHINIL